jgi:RpiB/LacA/LacB family sugar-phosphate isomerase
MKIAVGADHAGFEMKERVKQILEARGHEIQDMGTHSAESTDYPPYAFRVGEAVRDGAVERGVLVCDSGNGIAIAANKVEGVRAALAVNRWQGEMARRHNDANVLVLASALTPKEQEAEVIHAWLDAPFDGGRHARRIAQITEYERTHERR